MACICYVTYTGRRRGCKITRYNCRHSLSSALNPTRFMQTCLSNGSVSALAKKHYAYVFKLAKLQTLTIVWMDREDGANDST